MFLNYPNNPTGASSPTGFFERVVELAREHEILVVHDNAYSETTYDGYVAPSFLATPGRQGGRGRGLLALQGLQHDRLALRGDPRQRRRRSPTYWRLKTNVDSGLFEAVQLAGAAALDGPREPRRGDERDLRAPPRPGRRRAARDRRRRRRRRRARSTSGRRCPEGHTSTSFAELVLEEAAVVVSPGSMYGPSGEGFFRISLTTPDERLAEAVERLREHLDCPEASAAGSLRSATRSVSRRPGSRARGGESAFIGASAKARPCRADRH